MEGHSVGRKRKPFTKVCSSRKLICRRPLVSGLHYDRAPRPVACTPCCMPASARRTPILGLLVLLAACAASASPTEVAADTADAAQADKGLSGVASRIVELTNAARSKAGLSALRANAKLTEAAQLHAEQMARSSRLAHEWSGARYPKPEDRLAAAGYQWSAYAENIAMGQRNPAEAMDSWMHSSAHKANILHKTATEIGVGIARDAGGQPYYVQVFGRPR